jgi:putative component of toxin-antitoxin plasmid stabilization module
MKVIATKLGGLRYRKILRELNEDWPKHKAVFDSYMNCFKNKLHAKEHFDMYYKIFEHNKINKKQLIKILNYDTPHIYELRIPPHDLINGVYRFYFGFNKQGTIIVLLSAERKKGPAHNIKEAREELNGYLSK